MNQTGSTTQRANYGLDAPEVVRRFALLGVVGILLGLLLLSTTRSPVVLGLGNAFLWMGGSFLITCLVMLWGSKVGKLRYANRVVRSLALRGDEQVLDVGCGHGLMLITAAKYLPRGKAVGVDIWQQEDQAGNSAEATLANARLEGVADRIELRDGDARNLPFADATFDVVLSSWVLHNIYDSAGRAQAIREIVRVLKPGGRLAIADIRHAGEYAQVLKQVGLQNVMRSRPHFLFLIPTFLLTATKPEAV
jgi:SAM-dependent methyltransferase